jgi:lipopolysaccharide/colanic/teichoic acid biosynthesis glycosyltransferase
MQRLLDIVLSALALIALAPLLAPVAIILRFTGEGEIFFVQPRVGKEGRVFGLYKFATMLKNSPNIATGTITVKSDPRILPVGRFLRKTKINELPQLLNIFFGDMSLVGPRPQTQRCFEAFPVNTRECIVKVLPGLSGIGSIIFRDEEELLEGASDSTRLYDEVIMPYKGVLEEWYVTNRTIFTYVLVVLLTMWVVVFPRSAIVWKVFPTLPLPPENLRNPLRWRRWQGELVR